MRIINYDNHSIITRHVVVISEVKYYPSTRKYGFGIQTTGGHTYMVYDGLDSVQKEGEISIIERNKEIAEAKRTQFISRLLGDS